MRNFKNIETEIDLEDIYQDGMDIDELEEAVQTYISEQETIYYSNAMRYLIEHDTSLGVSIDIAIEYGYTLENINSELLATLLYQQNLQEEWNDIRDEVEEIIE